MAFGQQNLLSGHGPQIPTLVAIQDGSPAIDITLVSTSHAASKVDCVDLLSKQDGLDYLDWSETGGKVVCVAREMWDAEDLLFEAYAQEVDATIGKFSLRVPRKGTQSPGIYVFEAALLDKNSVPVIANAGYIEIQPSLLKKQKSGQTSLIPLLRRSIRDAHPTSNRVFEECEFTAAELYDAVTDAVEHFNTMPPIMAGVNFTWSTFPWPDKLIIGATARLLSMASVWYARNNIRTIGEGMIADDMSGKAETYRALAQQYQAEFDGWAARVRRQINIRRGWGRIRSRCY